MLARASVAKRRIRRKRRSGGVVHTSLDQNSICTLLVLFLRLNRRGLLGLLSLTGIRVLILARRSHTALCACILRRSRYFCTCDSLGDCRVLLTRIARSGCLILCQRSKFLRWK